MSYIYSPSSDSFFPLELKDAYVASGTWPNDGHQVEFDKFQQFIGSIPQGKKRGIDANGLLSWLDAEIVQPTQDEIKTSLTVIVQRYIDQQAQTMGYDNIASAATYADEPSVPKFQAEGQALRAWRSLVWEACYVLMDAVLAGTQPIPTSDELIAELPVFIEPSSS